MLVPDPPRVYVRPFLDRQPGESRQAARYRQQRARSNADILDRNDGIPNSLGHLRTRLGPILINKRQLRQRQHLERLEQMKNAAR